MARVPIILDTDIGDDVDDAWALAYLISHPRCDLRLVVTAFGDRDTHLARASAIRTLLAAAGRVDVPLALGASSWGVRRPRSDLGLLFGKHSTVATEGACDEDGVGAMIGVIEASSEPMTLVSIGPLCNVAAMLDRAGDHVAAKVHFVSMQGSVFRGYGNGGAPSAEHNVACDPAACARALAAPWLSRPRLAPLDTCGAVQLQGPLFKRLRESGSGLVRTLLEAHSAWLRNSPAAKRYYPDLDQDAASTVLYDTLAAFLALQPDGGGLLELRGLRLHVAADSHTLLAETGSEVLCAVEWQEGGLARFQEHLVDTLTGRSANL